MDNSVMFYPKCRKCLRKRILICPIILCALFLATKKTLNTKRDDISHSNVRFRSSDIAPNGRKRRHQQYMFNCANIHKIQIKNKIGNGACKYGYLGEYKGIRVVVKFAMENRTHLEACLKYLVSDSGTHLSQRCYYNCHTQVLKDILFMKQLRHANLVRLLGYCARSDEITQLDIRLHGAISVFEYGIRVTQHYLDYCSWPERIRHAFEIAGLINYFEYSPLGSIRYPDLKIEHFVLVDNRLKLFDMDSATATEERCDIGRYCKYRLPCVDGLCQGFNAMFNIRRMHDVLFRVLLSTFSMPDVIKSDVIRTKRALTASKLNATGLESELKIIHALLLNYGK